MNDSDGTMNQRAVRVLEPSEGCSDCQPVISSTSAHQLPPPATTTSFSPSRGPSAVPLPHDDEGGLDSQARGLRRETSSLLDSASAQGSFERVEGGRESRTCDNAGERASQAQESCGNQEGQPPGVREGVRLEGQRQHDHPEALQPGRGTHHEAPPTSGIGQRRLREVWLHDVRAAETDSSRLLPVGTDNQQGVRFASLAPCAPRQLARNDRGRGGLECRAPGVAALQRVTSSPLPRWCSSFGHGTCAPDSGESQFREGTCGCQEADRVPEQETTGLGESAPREPTPAEDTEGDVDCMAQEDDCLEACSIQSCHSGHKYISHQWREDRNPYSEAFQSLKQTSRPLVLEVACEQDSRLSSEALKQLGAGAALRCSVWNGYDLTTKEGVQRLKDLISSSRPLNVWFSCDCGPYSPLQRINQRTPEQQTKLQEKRAYADKQYQGGIQVARHARLCGAEIHWELSERCDAWKLPFIESFVQKDCLGCVTCNGCAVGLKVGPRQQLSCKGWTIASSSRDMLQHLHLPCQRNHKTVPLEGNKAWETALYTPVFVKKVVEAMMRQESWSLLSLELQQPPKDPEQIAQPPEAPEALTGSAEVTPAERARILKLIKHIHSVSGHGSLQTLIQALSARGVPKHVLEIAKTFKCSICEEKVRTSPRRPATLMTVPKKWHTIQTDIGTWSHPYTHKKYKFVLFIDEGCRYRAGKLLFQAQSRQASWEIIRQSFEEHWIAHFGQPEVIRGDSDGAWRNSQAEAYCSQRGIQLDFVPAEAHWQVGIVEAAIKSTKAVLNALCEEFRDMSMEECFSRALWACNSRDNHCGYSPLQHALGRSPDEWGRMFESEIKDFPFMPKRWLMRDMVQTSRPCQWQSKHSSRIRQSNGWPEQLLQDNVL